ncbi:MAG: hypothetical protein WCL50_18265 [Spirochaetota bacterium]
MVDLKKTMEALATTRSIFHSEADFQFSLAWELQRLYPSLAIRLEWRPGTNLGIDHVDILLIEASMRYGIELKYKTRAFEGTVGDEHYSLKNQAAQDCGRYDFVADIGRLETLKRKGKIDSGFAIFLTNDPSYWAENNDRDTADRAFRIGEGAELSGVRAWAPGTGKGTTKSREGAIKLTGRYLMKWS